jgi:excisionase family DNA binding protein
MDDNKIVVYDLKEIETMLKVTRRTLLSYIKAGKLTATKIGGKWIVTRENLERFINGK